MFSNEPRRTQANKNRFSLGLSTLADSIVVIVATWQHGAILNLLRFHGISSDFIRFSSLPDSTSFARLINGQCHCDTTSAPSKENGVRRVQQTVWYKRFTTTGVYTSNGDLSLQNMIINFVKQFKRWMINRHLTVFAWIGWIDRGQGLAEVCCSGFLADSFQNLNAIEAMANYLYDGLSVALDLRFSDS